MNQRMKKLTELIKKKYNNDDPGHDFAHIMRVIATCNSIGKSAGANLEILIPAALLHDVVNLPKDHPERKQASQKAAEEAKSILKNFDYSENEVSQITTVIIEHSYSLGKRPSNIESAVLQDADRLDALGAIGIMRTVTCGCRLGASYYDVGDPFAKVRELDDKRFTIDHFFVKLFKLADTVNTQDAKNEANKRIEFMRFFLDQLAKEI